MYLSPRLYCDRIKAFLLNHSLAYTAAILAAIAEVTLLHWIMPWWRLGGSFMYLGIVCVVLGQVLRSRAMIDAGDAFTHEIAQEHVPSHKLVKTGLYAYYIL